MARGGNMIYFFAYLAIGFVVSVLVTLYGTYDYRPDSGGEMAIVVCIWPILVTGLLFDVIFDYLIKWRG
jgi:hypothetical protein